MEELIVGTTDKFLIILHTQVFTEDLLSAVFFGAGDTMAGSMCRNGFPKFAMSNTQVMITWWCYWACHGVGKNTVSESYSPQDKEDMINGRSYRDGLFRQMEQTL